jgi:hypothetical protein
VSAKEEADAQRIYCRFEACGTTLLKAAVTVGKIAADGRRVSCPMARTSFGSVRSGLFGREECRVRISFNKRHFSDYALEFILSSNAVVFNFDSKASSYLTSSNGVLQPASPIKLRGVYMGGQMGHLTCLFNMGRGKGNKDIVYPGTTFAADDESLECAPPLATPLGYYGSVANETQAGLMNYRHFDRAMPRGGNVRLSVAQKVSSSTPQITGLIDGVADFDFDGLADKLDYSKFYEHNDVVAIGGEEGKNTAGFGSYRKAMVAGPTKLGYGGRRGLNDASNTYGFDQDLIYVETFDAPSINYVYPSNSFYRNALMPYVYVFGSNFPPAPVKYCQFLSKYYDDRVTNSSILYYMAKSNGVRMSSHRVACDFPNDLTHAGGNYKVQVAFMSGAVANTN